MSYTAQLFFQSIQSSIEIREMQKQIELIIFDLEIIAFELVALNTRFYWERILVIGCQFVTKQSQDFKYH